MKRPSNLIIAFILAIALFWLLTKYIPLLSQA